MIQVWAFDGNSYFIESKIIEEEEMAENMTTVPLLTGYVKAKWSGVEWVEGATTEEIEEWNLVNQPKPQEPSTEDILLEYVADLDYRLSLKEMGL